MRHRRTQPPAGSWRSCRCPRSWQSSSSPTRCSTKRLTTPIAAGSCARLRSSGLPGSHFSEQRSAWTRLGDGAPSEPGPLNEVRFGLSRAREDLCQRIDRRVDQMLEQGLVEEVKRLIPIGLADHPTASQALGYRQILAHLRGELTLSEARVQIQAKTRHYAKRQMTWFRRQMRLAWTEISEGDRLDTVAELLGERYRTASRTITSHQ